MTTMNAEDRLNKMLLDAKNRVYKSRANNTEKYKEYQKNLMRERRAKKKLENKDAENKKNADYQKKYRANLKEQAIKVNAINNISNAIKNLKIRKEYEEELKEQKATKDLISNIVNDAITQATTKTTKKGRPAGSKNKKNVEELKEEITTTEAIEKKRGRPAGAKNKVVDVKTYNLRSRGK